MVDSACAGLNPYDHVRMDSPSARRRKVSLPRALNRQAANLAWLVCNSDEEFAAMFRWLRLHTRSFVKAGLGMISAVAEALIAHGKLSGEEVGAIALRVLSH